MPEGTVRSRLPRDDDQGRRSALLAIGILLALFVVLVAVVWIRLLR
ncbi:MAG: hypothetical protein ACXVD1_07030 [Nocardioides sp.]|jgi:hypothetical protein